MRIHYCVSGLVALSLAACASRPPADWSTSVRFESSPAGAEVIRDGVVIGRTPLWQFYGPNNSRIDAATSGALPRPGGCPSSAPVTFRWASGATATVTDPCRNPQLVTATRPADAPNLKRDRQAEQSIMLALRQFGTYEVPDKQTGMHAPNQGLVSSGYEPPPRPYAER